MSVSVAPRIRGPGPQLRRVGVRGVRDGPGRSARAPEASGAEGRGCGRVGVEEPREEAGRLRHGGRRWRVGARPPRVPGSEPRRLGRVSDRHKPRLTGAGPGPGPGAGAEAREPPVPARGRGTRGGQRPPPPAPDRLGRGPGGPRGRAGRRRGGGWVGREGRAGPVVQRNLRNNLL